MTNKKIKKGKTIGRREFNKLGLGVIVTITASSAAFALYKFFSPDSDLLYEKARYDSTLQKKWIKETLTKNCIDDLFGEVIIVTPQNAAIANDTNFYTYNMSFAYYEQTTIV